MERKGELKKLYEKSYTLLVFIMTVKDIDLRDILLDEKSYKNI